jgi:hypothetical protein
MVRLQEDIDGCGCLRCQEVDHEVVRRSLADILYWSTRLPFARPSILLVFGAVGLLQLGVLVTPTALSMALVGLGVLGVFIGRGYIGVVGRGALGHEKPTPSAAVRTVLHRFPAFLGAVVAVILLLVLLVAVVVSVLSPGGRWLATVTGTDPVLAELGTLFLLVALVVYTLLKACFIPEACFIGGYGPLTSVRVSWRITSVHRLKAVLILAGFAVLIALGIVLDTQLAGAGAPVALSVEVGGTTVVLRSFGLSLAGGVRFTFDLAVTALYSGMFVHQYVESTVSAR